MVSHQMIALRMQEEIDDLRAALAQPEQEPVAYQWLGTSVIRKRIPKTAEADAWAPLYTRPPQRLIAAAPELLAALKQFVAWSKEESHNTGSTFLGRVEMLRDLDAAASAAIEKAHGIGGEA
jgi:hypothetical protein